MDSILQWHQVPQGFGYPDLGSMQQELLRAFLERPGVLDTSPVRNGTDALRWNLGRHRSHLDETQSQEGFPWMHSEQGCCSDRPVAEPSPACACPSCCRRRLGFAQPDPALLSTYLCNTLIDNWKERYRASRVMLWLVELWLLIMAGDNHEEGRVCWSSHSSS
jgi:hypothetical protein